MRSLLPRALQIRRISIDNNDLLLHHGKDRLQRLITKHQRFRLSTRDKIVKNTACTVMVRVGRVCRASVDATPFRAYLRH